MVINKKIMQDKMSVFINGLIFISIAGLSTAWDISRASFIVLFLCSCYFFVKNYRYICISLFEKIIFLSTLLFVLSGALSYFYNSPYLFGYRVVFENYVLLVMLAPISIIIRYTNINNRLIYLAFIFLVILSSLYIFIAVYNGMTVRGFLSWLEYNSLIFSMILTTAILTVLQYAIKTNKIVSWLALALGLVAIYFTEARACWVSLIAISFYIIIVNINMTKNKIIIWLAFFMLIIGSLQTPNVKHRINSALSNISDYQKGSKSSSLGHRFELYKMALYFYKQQPILGIGPRRLGDTEFKLQHENINVFQAEFFNHWHFHNQYLNSLATQGSLGLISLLLLFGILLTYFHKNRKVTSFATAGSIVIFSYLLFGITEVTFEHKRLTLFFSLLMALLIAMVEKEKRNEQ